MRSPYIPKNKKGRRFVVSDIHGCLATFKALLTEKIKLTKDDQLILLGDYINRGPDSLGVLDLIIQLEKDGFQIYPLIGNHETMYLEQPGAKISDQHREFMDNLAFFYETSDFYFSHAGLNFDAEDPLEDTFAMMWGTIYPVEPDLDFLNGKKVIHGHKKYTLSDIFDAIHEDAPIVPLDNGCYEGLWTPGEGKGNLCAIDLDKWELIVQENLDEPGFKTWVWE